MLDEKLQKVLATAGFGSRREMEKAIEAGLIKVNGEVAKLGSRVKAGDKLIVNGHRFVVPTAAENRSDLRVILYNKPEGEICSRNDPEKRPTVFERLPPLQNGRWISVGRLDFNTSGLLLFTNNGELANKLMHPSSNIDREYLVRVQGEVSNDQLQQLRDGVELDDGQAKFSDITIGGGKGANTWYYCTVMEGRNREVRRLWESQGCRVSRLKRVRYGQILIPSYVRMGQWIELSEGEVGMLCETAGLRAPAKKKFQRNEVEQQERRIRRLRSSPGKPVIHKSRGAKTASERAAGMERPWLDKPKAEKPSADKFKKKPSLSPSVDEIPSSVKTRGRSATAKPRAEVAKVRVSRGERAKNEAPGAKVASSRTLETKGPVAASGARASGVQVSRTPKSKTAESKTGVAKNTSKPANKSFSKTQKSPTARPRPPRPAD